MLFTIVTPSYNQVEFIEQTILSVIGQSYKNFEHIVVDGNSNDGSHRILDKYKCKLKKVIIEDDEGQSDAINKGFSFAEGDIFAYLNSDDYYFRDTLKLVTEVFRDNPDVDVVYGDCVFTDAKGQFLRYFTEIEDFNKSRLLNNTDYIMQPATFWRRGAFEQYGCFDKNLHYGFDWAYWCELAKHDCKFLRINEVLAANRIHPATKTLSGDQQRLKELKGINFKYKTKNLLHAYYGFSREEYRSKTDKGFIDYFRFMMYILLSYQNIIYHIKNYDKKIINGVLPKSRWLLKFSRIRLPRLSNSKLQICLSAPSELAQKVIVYSNDKLLGEYGFDDGVFEIEFNLENGDYDVDIRFEFFHEFLPTHNTVMQSLLFYKPSKVSALLNVFEMS